MVFLNLKDFRKAKSWVLYKTQVRGFAPIGILEYWNHGFWADGMVGLENQNEYNCIDFRVIVAYFLGQKQKMDV